MNDRIDIPEYAAQIIRRIEDAGFEAYIVGGSVRDSLMGRPVHDYDLTTSAVPDEMLAIFSRPGDRVLPTGIKHGTVSVRGGDEWLEITTYRVDGSYSDGRHPDSVLFTRALADDLSRRDFTVNAMAYSDRSGIVDLFGGRDDIRRRVIRCVGDPELRFTEDALRILRAFRFAARLGFSIDADTLRAATELRGRLALIAAERKAAELCGLLAADDPAPTLRLMRACGVLGVILPDVIGRLDAAGDCFGAVSRVRADAAIRLGTLLRGVPREEVEACVKNLKFSNDDCKKTVAAATFPLPTDAGEASLRRFAGAYGPHADTVLAAAAAHGERLPDGSDAAEARKKLAAVLASGAPLTLKSLAVNGNDLAAAGIAKGRETGRILAALLAEVLEDPSRNEREALLRRAEELRGEKAGNPAEVKR